MKHRLTLDYRLGEGALAPYLDGLREGRAEAHQCRNCQRVTFPPERACVCAQGSGDTHTWTTLAGTADIIHRTGGPEGAFALVRFSGADNSAIGRITNPGVEGDKARLIAAAGDLPGLMLEITGGAVETA